MGSTTRSRLPAITGPSGGGGSLTSAKTIAENTQPVHTFTSSETVTWSLVGGEDQGKFNVNANTGALSFIAAPDFENPTDGTSSGSNTYIVQLRATDAAGNTSNQTVTVTVSDGREVRATFSIRIRDQAPLSPTSSPEGQDGLAPRSSAPNTDGSTANVEEYDEPREESELVAGSGDSESAPEHIHKNVLLSPTRFMPLGRPALDEQFARFGRQGIDRDLAKLLRNLDHARTLHSRGA